MEEPNVALDVVYFIIKNIVTPIVVTLSTMYIVNKIEKSKRIKESFNYEFYDLYLKSHNGGAYNFTDLNMEDQKKFMDIINKNDKYVNGILLQLFYEFRVRTGNKDMYDERIINNIFNEITDIACSGIKHNMIITKRDAKKIKKRLLERQQDENIYYIKNIDENGFINTY